MTNRVLYFLITLLFSAKSVGQVQEIQSNSKDDNFDKEAYIGIHLGWAYAMGSFSESTENGGSAFAKNGSNLTLLDFGYRINNSLICGLSFINISNDVNTDELESFISNQEYTYQVDASNYELKALMIGIGVSKSSSTVDFDIKFNVGYGKTFLPEFELVQKNRATEEKEVLNFLPADENGFGIGLNGAIRIHLNEYLDFTSNASYVIFQKSFEQIEVSNPANANNTSTINYETASITFGLAYRFNFKFNE